MPQIDCKIAVLRTQTSNKVKSILTADIFFSFLSLKIIFFAQTPLVVNIIKQLFHSISSYMANSRLGYASSAISSCTTRFRGIIVNYTIELFHVRHLLTLQIHVDFGHTNCIHGICWSTLNNEATEKQLLFFLLLFVKNVCAEFFFFELK